MSEMQEIRDLLKKIMVKLDYIHNRTAMWEHFCVAEGTYLSVERGCECNWCGKTEQDTAEFGTLDEGIKLD